MGKAPQMSNGATLNYGKGKLGFTANITRFDNDFAQGFIDNRVQEGFQVGLRNSESRKEEGFNISTSVTYTMNDKHSVNFSGWCNFDRWRLWHRGRYRYLQGNYATH